MADRAHGYVIHRLSNCAEDEVNEAGKKLDELRRLRNRADYEKRRTFDAEDAEYAVAISRECTETMDDALPEPIRSQITEAIKNYERDVLKEVSWRA